tara:strand:- start:276 stop:497 length:222 start_codon:yes stop_codon:yes gene_type:complete
MNELIERMKYWRCERPDEWTMDEFIRDTEASIKRAYMKALEVSDDLHLTIGCSESEGDAVKEYLWNEYKGELK